MSSLLYLTDAQMARLQPFFPKSHGKPRVVDQRALRGIIFINRNGWRCCDTPKEYGPPKILDNRRKRWCDKGGPSEQRGRLIGRTKGGMNTKLHAVTDADGRPIRFFMTVGQVSEYSGSAAPLGNMPKAERLLADRGYDAERFREALKDKGIESCFPGRKSHDKPIRHE